jgi:hypothetical protein
VKLVRAQRKSAVSIIGGADGPTSVFVAGKSKKRSVKIRIKNVIYRYKRRKVEKTIAAAPHSLDETVQYAKDKYKLIETASDDEEYLEQIKSLKESLILQHKPEVLGEMQVIPTPDYTDDKAVKEFLGKLKMRSEMINAMPDSILSMDFHLYRVRIGDGLFEMGIDFMWNIFGTSYSGNKKEMKQFEKISKELYLYYGVNTDDIQNRTARYSALVTVLSS